MLKKILLLLFPLFVLAIVRFAFDFNGLYGQDAFEYLRYAGRLREFLANGTPPGDYFWPVGYPFYGATLSFLTGDVSFALQLVSALGLAGTAWFAVKMLELLFPGKKGIHLYVFLFLLCSPFLLRSAVLCMSDCACAFFVTAFFYYTFRFRKDGKGIHLVLLFFLAANAMMFRYASAVLLVIPALSLVKFALKRNYLLFLLAGCACFALALLPHFLVRADRAVEFLGNQWLERWSVMNYFRTDFETADGVQQYTLPNIAYALGGIFHPGNFAFGLITLFFLFRRGGWKREERILLGSALLYVLFLAGIPYQNYRFFLLALPLVIAGSFGGFVVVYEFVRAKYVPALATLAAGAQLLLFGYGISIFYERNRLEATIGEWIGKNTSHATLYTFDMDVALKANGLNRQFVNLWENEYDTFRPNSLVLFNEQAFEKQWKGKNPMKNWERMKRERRLKLLKSFGQGWELYELR